MAVAWKNAIVGDSPTCLILSRQSLPKLPLTKDHISQIDNGGYVLRDSDNPKINLIATGSEVQLAIEAYAFACRERNIFEIISCHV